MHTEHLRHVVWLIICIYFHILIGKSCLKCSNECSPLLYISFQAIQNIFFHRVQSWKYNHIILFHILAFRPDEVALYIHFIQCVINPSHHIIITDSFISCCRCLNSEPVQCRQSFIADHNRNFIVFFKSTQLFTVAMPFISNNLCLFVHSIFLEIMA